MSAQATRVASQAAKAADRSFLNRGAKRDPELYVGAPFRHCLLLAPLETDFSPPLQFAFESAKLCADSYGSHVGSLWSCWLLFWYASTNLAYGRTTN